MGSFLSTLPRYLLRGVLTGVVSLFTLFAGAQTAFAVCGDGVTDPNTSEECDDGNTVSGDGCTALCGFETFSDGCMLAAAPAVGNCTSNDVSFSEFTVIEVTDGCTDPNDTFTAKIKAAISPQAATRYDIGLWVNLDGTDAITGASCHREILTPITTDPNALDLTGGDGPFRDEENDPNVDVCGDARDGSELAFKNLLPLEFACEVDPNTGLAQISAATTWSNSAGAIDCRSVLDAIPSSPSKCSIELFTVNVPVPNLSIDKVCTPDPVSPGDPVSCTITYTNDGPSTPGPKSQENQKLRIRCSCS